jgi:hypothetical protein
MINHKSKILTLVMVLVFGLVFTGYVFGSTNADFIRIVSVTPNSNLVDGIEHQFTVTVEYNLSTREQGIIYIGFNTIRSNRYRLVSQNLIVNKGRGTHTFNVTAIPKNWFPNDKFEIYANLSPYPHGSSWNPLVFNIRELTF